MTDNIPHPDPAWDYYIEWHKLMRAKAQLDKLIEFISKVENATEDIQEIGMPVPKTITHISQNHENRINNSGN